ncbi:MAG: hypothetical protein HGA49_02355 [Eubacteriaceae bacterium]|nr:hypothetical protein [Eubacteriaceae bacterium]
MKSNKTMIVVALIILAAALSGAGVYSWQQSLYKDIQVKLDQKDVSINLLTEENKNLKTEIQNYMNQQKTSELLVYSNQVLKAIKDKDMNQLSKYVHPDKGVRFSPYAYVDMNASIVLTPDQIKQAMTSTQKYLWGVYDGKGDDINLTFSEYYGKFIYDQDFINAVRIGRTYRVGLGNSLDNIKEVYPDGEYIEYNFPGFDPKYEGMDWKSIRLIFENVDGKWYLVCVVHDQWTI